MTTATPATARTLDSPIRDWVTERKETVLETVSVFDVLRINGIHVKSLVDRKTQIQCPFHGKDDKPSSTVFPSEPGNPGHVWCYVCQTNLDAVGLWRAFEGCSFMEALSGLEKEFGITPPPAPKGEYQARERVVSQEEADLNKAKHILQMCENRILTNLYVYREMGEWVALAAAGTAIDKLTHVVVSGRLKGEQAVKQSQDLLDRINSRIRRGLDTLDQLKSTDSVALQLNDV